MAPWFEAEARSHTLRYWQPNVVPGILQSEHYCYEVMRAGGKTDDQAKAGVAAQMQRQERVP